MTTATNTECAKTIETKKLYMIRTTAKAFPHRGRVYRGVNITWFVNRRQDEEPPVPYSEAIADYDQLSAEDGGRDYVHGHVDELFTEAEAKVFQAYLSAVHGEGATLKEVILPMNCTGQLPTGAFPVGGGTDFYLISEEPEYNLRFQVLGFFDVCECECLEQAETVRIEDGRSSLSKIGHKKLRPMGLDDPE